VHNPPLAGPVYGNPARPIPLEIRSRRFISPPQRMKGHFGLGLPASQTSIRRAGVHPRGSPLAAKLYNITEFRVRSGRPHFYVEVWHGLWAPKGTPPEIVAKLNAAAQDALCDPMVRERLTALGFSFPDSADLSPAASGALQKSEIAKWWPIVKLADIKGE
jgi:Tripartite tricarboxylate transporter family receptor